MYNILDKKKESDRIVFEDTDPEKGFILLPDMKWDRKDLNSLYLVAIVTKHGLKSLRDLDKDALPLLKNIREKGLVKILLINLIFQEFKNFHHDTPGPGNVVRGNQMLRKGNLYGCNWP